MINILQGILISTITANKYKTLVVESLIFFLSIISGFLWVKGMDVFASECSETSFY